jgi:tetratricopeptide (TPR) repeat protein
VQQYQKALALLQELATAFPAVPQYRNQVAINHNSLGVLLTDLGKWPEAEQQYQKSLTLLQELADDFPSEPEYRHGLANSHVNLGNLWTRLGKRPEAERQLRQALALFEKLAADFSAVPAFRQDLASGHDSLGILLKDLAKWPEAEQQLRQALAIQQKLAADLPAVPQYQIDLGGGYCNLGNLLRASGRPGESLVWYDKAIRTLTAVHEQERQVVQAKEFLRNSHLGRATACHHLQKYAEAVKDWDRVIELGPKQERSEYRAIRAAARVKAGQVAEAVAEVAELARTPTRNADQWYNVACVYALASSQSADNKQEYADRAMELLHQAVTVGYQDAAQMKEDTDLDPLRARDDFQKLIAELAKKAAAKPEKQP